LSRAMRTFSLAVSATAVLSAFAILGLVLAGRLTFGTVSDAFGVLTGFKAASTHAEKVEFERLREEARWLQRRPGGRELGQALREELRRSRRAKLAAGLLEARELSEALREELRRSRRAKLAAGLLEAQRDALRTDIERHRTESLAEVRREREVLDALKKELENELATRASDATKSLARLYLRMDRAMVAEDMAERWRKGEKDEVAAVLREMGEHAASSVLEGVADASVRGEMVRTAWSGIK